MFILVRSVNVVSESRTHEFVPDAHSLCEYTSHVESLVFDAIISELSSETENLERVLNVIRSLQKEYSHEGERNGSGEVVEG